MILDSDIERLISAALLRLRMRSPFFATLALFARVEANTDIASIATDGRSVFVNPEFARSLASAALDSALLHQVLHAALLHVPRRGARDRQLWNMAADIVVNGLIAEVEGVALPEGALRDQRRESLSVEEVYELLLREGGAPAQVELDLLDLPPGAVSGGSERESIATGRNAALEAHWRNAHQHANIIALAVAQGRLPAHLARELGMLEPARLDWRAHLWRYMAQTPTDFQGYDRRFIGRGLYLDALESETLRVYVAVDTSGSVDDHQIRALVGEVQGILRAYPHVSCDLYYADSQAYGPYPLAAGSAIPPPTGGGGTDFRPFFEAVAARRAAHETAVCIYLTDGYGDFPAEPPELPVLWVATAGGRALEQFPFGESVRLLDDQ
jgi:predicted metal-dependent peptidase